MVVNQAYPNGWVAENEYDNEGRVVKVWDIDPSQKDLKTIKHTYTYDPVGNMLTEYKRGNGQGQAKEDWAYQYDALNRLTQAHENHGNETRNYQYDSLGNLTYEWNSNNVIVDYKLNTLNQITQKTDDGWKTWTDYSYDKRGNTIQKIYNKNNKHTVIGNYVYDETNRMTQGTNDIGEQSTYQFNGLGILVTNEWLIKKNAYGYHDVTAATVLDPSEELVVEPTTGEKKAKGKKKPEEVAVDPELNKTSHVIKDFVIDYNSEAQENLMEYELYDEGLTYRYVYGVDKLGVTVYSIPNGSASITTTEDTILLYYHMDHMGSSEFLTSDVTQRVTSWTSYDEWGNITHNAVLKCGYRELDLVKNYTGHERDSVLGMYYAKARLYDTADKHGSTKGNKLGDKRFMAVDPVKGNNRNPQSMVQYTYTLNNPLMYVDPLGEFYEQGIPMISETGYGEKTKYIFVPLGYIDAGGRSAAQALGSTGIGGVAAIDLWESMNHYVGGNSALSKDAKAAFDSVYDTSLTNSAIANIPDEKLSDTAGKLGTIFFVLKQAFSDLDVVDKDKLVQKLLNDTNTDITSYTLGEVSYRALAIYDYIDQQFEYFQGTYTCFNFARIRNVGPTNYEIDKQIARAPNPNQQIEFLYTTYYTGLLETGEPNARQIANDYKEYLSDYQERLDAVRETMKEIEKAKLPIKSGSKTKR